MSDVTSLRSSVQLLPGGFPRLPSGWRWERLDPLCEGIYDCPHSTPELTDSGPYLVRTQDFPDGVLKMQGMAHVSRETFLERVTRATPKHGDILYSREGSYHGIAAEVPEGQEICMGQRMVLIRPDRTALNFRLLRHWLNSTFVRSFIAGMREGSGAPRINLPTIRNMPIPTPPLTEQNSIADILGALDDKIAVNESIATTAEALTLTLAVRERWEGRIRLDEICQLRKDQVSPRAITDASVDHYSLPAFDSGKMPDRVSPAEIKSSKFLITEPAVLLSKLNPDIPRVWNVTPNPGVPSLASTEFLVLTPRGPLTTHELWAVTAQQAFLDDLASKVTGTSKSHQRVRPAEVLATEVVDPRQFGETGPQLQSLANRAALARRESQALVTLRDTLLPQLMSGRLRLKDAEKIVEDHV